MQRARIDRYAVPELLGPFPVPQAPTLYSDALRLLGFRTPGIFNKLLQISGRVMACDERDVRIEADRDRHDPEAAARPRPAFREECS